MARIWFASRPVARERPTRSVLFVPEGTVTDQMMELEHELEQLRTKIAALEAALQEKPDYGIGEGDPAVTSWELDHALLQDFKERQTSLEQALQRLDQGTYGVCEQCGNAIHPDRLAILPDTKMCIRCAQAEARTGDGIRGR